MIDLFLIAEARGTKFAIPAERVETIVRDVDIVAAPLCDPWVAGIAALRSRVIAVVDLVAAITRGAIGACADRPVIVTPIDGDAYGFVVDRVDDIVEAKLRPLDLQNTPSSVWRSVSTGYIETDLGAVIVIDPELLIGGVAKAA